MDQPVIDLLSGLCEHMDMKGQTRLLLQPWKKERRSVSRPSRDGCSRIANTSTLGRRARLVRGPQPPDIIAHTQTPGAPGAHATVHISGLLAGRASRPG